MDVLLNFLLPVSLLLSIGAIIYAIILFLSSINGGKKSNRIKAVKVATVPLVYISGVLTLAHFKRVETNQSIVRELTGVYRYHRDKSVSNANLNFESRFTINKDFTYSYYNNYHGDTSFVGTWKVAEDRSSFILCNDKGAKLWNVKWKEENKRTVLSIVQDGAVLIFIKEN